MTIRIHGFAQSTYVRTVRMAAIEKGLSHELVPLAYHQPAHFALHPFGKMPVLTHDGTTVYETLAILDHLDGLAGPRLIPADPAARVPVSTVISAAIDYAYRQVVHGDAEAAAPVFDWLEARLDGQAWLAGAALTAADLFLAPMLAYHFAEHGRAALDSRPRLAGWYQRIAARPSFEQTAAMEGAA